MQSTIQRNRVILLHLSFWCVYISFFVYQMASFRRHEHDIEPMEIFVQAASNGIFNILVAYLNYFIFLPRFLERKKVGQYLLEFFIPFAILMFLRVHLQRYLADGYSHQVHYFYNSIFIVQASATSLFIVIFVGMLRFAQEWFEFESKKKEVENERLQAELNFLKAQINPHFLFNTLNNLYYLAYSQSPNTTEVIAKLSQMMRYMIYDTNYQQVLLSKEIEYMQNYISLERLRLNNQIPIDFTIQGNVQDARISPFIFITFLENAFKHGITNNSTDAWVKASIAMEGKTCIYRVENSKYTAPKNGHSKSGIGLQNVQRRLDLSYPGRHTLKVENTPDHYSVELKLILS
ncbi:sensor histidine kinase [Ohtaekwangia sp.]|uniref:sensor histidine kinase n=1 Tax=Ohtaekwangia sp. TaxID=2066019 RepID=UPI002F95A78C